MVTLDSKSPYQVSGGHGRMSLVAEYSPKHARNEKLKTGPIHYELDIDKTPLATSNNVMASAPQVVSQLCR